MYISLLIVCHILNSSHSHILYYLTHTASLCTCIVYVFCVLCTGLWLCVCVFAIHMFNSLLSHPLPVVES